MTLRTTAIPVSDPTAGLRITEIFYSLQGEAAHAGLPTVFIRLTGCPLRCTYCDTTYSFEGGQRMALADILSQAQAFNTPYICVTGGEPLAQPNCIPLLQQLCTLGFSVSLETSGAIDISQVNPLVSRVVDVKTPSSGESHRNLIANYPLLTPHDQIKFVISDHTDYLWSKDFLDTHQLQQHTKQIWFSPAFAIDKAQAKLPALASDLAQWILKDQLPVRFQLQLHKLLWHDEMGR